MGCHKDHDKKQNKDYETQHDIYTTDVAAIGVLAPSPALNGDLPTIQRVRIAPTKAEKSTSETS
jgi:hypothetical protein